jgi:aminoglycoside N3'-acetyltransferase
LKRISIWVIVTSIEWNEIPQFELMDSIWLDTTKLRTLTMHSKAIKICTLKFLGCQLAQRVHGSKVEVKESKENSKALNWTS